MGAVDTVDWACVLCDHQIQNDWVGRAKICIRSCIKLEHLSTETILMVRRPQLWATGDWQLHHDNISAHASRLMQCFWLNIKSYRCLSPSIAQILCFVSWLLPKLKSPLKENRFQTFSEIRENTRGKLMAIGRTVWGPKVSTLKETEASLSCVQCFLYLVPFKINVSTFHSTWLDTSKTFYEPSSWVIGQTFLRFSIKKMVRSFSSGTCVLYFLQQQLVLF